MDTTELLVTALLDLVKVNSRRDHVSGVWLLRPRLEDTNNVSAYEATGDAMSSRYSAQASIAAEKQRRIDRNAESLRAAAAAVDALAAAGAVEVIVGHVPMFGAVRAFRFVESVNLMS